MEPILIDKDERRIEEEKQHLIVVVGFLQQLHDAFKAVGIDVTLPEMANLLQYVNMVSRPHALEEFVADKMLDKAGEPNFNGVPIRREKLRDMLDLPDFSAIAATIGEYQLISRDGFGIRLNLLTLAAGVVAKGAGADASLEQEFTYFTKNDRGAEVAGHLKAVCDSLNGWNVFSNSFGWELKGGHDEEMIPGVLYRNGSFMPSLNFIRRQEALA